MIDNHISVETPESIELQLVPAGPVVRILAYMTDWCLRAAILIALALGLDGMGQMGSGMMFIIYFVLEWFYAILFEMLADGATPGKRLMGLQVVHDDGTPLGWGASILRNLLRGADALPFGYAAGIISMVTSRGFKRLGDHVGGTLVVYRQQEADKIDIQTRGSRPVPFPMTQSEQQAILSFVERSNKLSVARTRELADILSPALKVEENKRVEEINKIANGIIGQS